MGKSFITSLIALSASCMATEIIQPEIQWRITGSDDKPLLEVIIDSGNTADLKSLSADERPDNHGQNKRQQDVAANIEQHVQIIDNRIRKFLNLSPVTMRLDQNCSSLSIESPKIPAGNIVLTPSGVTTSERRKINLQVLELWLASDTGITEDFCNDIKKTDNPPG